MSSARPRGTFERLSGVAEEIYFLESDQKTNVARWSDNAVRYFGLPQGKVEGALQPWMELVHIADRVMCEQEFDALLAGERDRMDCRYRVKNLRGDYVWLECHGKLTRDRCGLPKYLDCVMVRRDDAEETRPGSLWALPECYKPTTSLEEDMNALADCEKRPIGIFVVADGATQHRNATFNQLTSLLKVLEETFPENEIYQEDGRALVLLARGLDYNEFSLKRKRVRDYILDNGWDSLSFGYAWCDSPSQLRQQLAMACTRQQLMESRMNNPKQRRYYALDKLTRIPQMDYFTEFAQAIVQNEAWEDEYVFLYFNIDNFKAFNSEYGFETGNRLLADFAQLISAVFPNYVSGRVASDRFVALTNTQDLIPRIERIHQAVHEQQFGATMEVKVGICLYTPDMTVEAACDNAKLACDALMGDYSRVYRYYDSELGEAVARQKHLLDNLDTAIREEHLKVYYQPIVRLLTSNLCAMESLVRWEDPKYGFLNPGEFIPLLEKHRLIHRLDAFVLDRVCRDLMDTQQKGYAPLPVSVNFSRKDFQMMDVFEMVNSTVKKYGVAPSLIHVEVTESALNDNAKQLAETIARFQAAGFEVWLDDFGSEYSTLNVLQEYHFDVLKIDMRFFAQMESNPNAKIIIASVVDMAKKLHTRVLAEGIETEEQYKFVRSLGCDKAQGYYICRPCPPSTLDKELVRGQSSGRENRFTYMETPDQARFYDDVGRVNCLSHDPIKEFTDAAKLDGSASTAILRLQDGRLSYIFANSGSRERWRAAGVATQEQAEQLLNDPTKLYGVRLRALLNKCHKTGRCEVLDLVAMGNQIHIRACEVAADKQARAYLVVMSNLRQLLEERRSEQQSRALNYLYTIYNRVDMLDVGKDHMGNIYLNVEDYSIDLPDDATLAWVHVFAQQNIAPKDQEKFLQFYDVKTLKARLTQSERGYLATTMLTRMKNDSMKIQLYIIIPVLEDEGERYLTCVRDIEPAEEEVEL